MQLFINHEHVEVEFDREKNLIDVYQSIEAEAARHSRYILECRVDDREVTGDFLKQTPIDDVEKMHFLVGDSQGVLLRTARTIDRYLDRIGNALFYSEELGEGDLEELRSGISWIREFAEAACGLLGLDLATFTVPLPDGEISPPVGAVLNTLARDVASLKTGETGTDLEPVLAGLRALKSFTSRLIIRMNADLLSSDDIASGLDHFGDSLSSLVERIVNVNERYQSGRDEEAVQLLDTVMDEMDRSMPFVFAALERIPEQQRGIPAPALAPSDPAGGDRDQTTTLEEVGAGLLGLLGDLSAALEEGDVVAAGDILEYELADRLRHLGPFLAELKKLLPEDRPAQQP